MKRTRQDAKVLNIHEFVAVTTARDAAEFKTNAMDFFRRCAVRPAGDDGAFKLMRSHGSPLQRAPPLLPALYVINSGLVAVHEMRNRLPCP